MSAKQVIGVTLQTDGEKQFKQNISDCNKALKTMRSEMDLVKEKTAGQANSLDSLRQKHSVLEKTLDKYKEKQSEIRKGLVESEDTHNKLGKALEEHKKKLSDAEKELEKMKNSTSASNDEIEKQEKYVESLKKELQQGEEAYRATGNKVEDWQRQLNTAEAQVIKATRAVEENNDLIREAEQASDGCAKSIDEYGKKTSDTTQRISEMDTVLKRFASLEAMERLFDKASQAAQKLGQSAYDAALELDEGYDTIITKTGATGEALDSMKGIADNIFGSMPAEMADVGSAVGEVNTRFKLTGDALEDTSRIFLQFAQINDTDVSDSVDQTDRIMKIFGVDASDTAEVLGLFTKVGQDTGMAMDTLMGTLDSNGATFQELGFGLEQSATMLAEFEKNGVDTSGVLTALRKGVVNASKEGKSANTMLKEASAAIKNAETDTEALQIATEYFGTKGAVVMAEGIRSGRISLDEASESMSQYGDVVSRTFEETLDPWDQAKVAMNNLKVAGSNLAGNALGTLTPAIEKVTDLVKKANEWFNRQDESTQKLIGSVAGIGTAFVMAAPKVLQMVESFKLLQAAQVTVSSATQAGTTAMTASLTAFGPLIATMGLAAAAGGALGLALIAISEHFDNAETPILDFNAHVLDTADAAAKARSAVEESTGMLEATSASAEQTMQEAQTAAELAGVYADELVDLAGKSELTTEEQTKLRGIVQKLDEIYPGFSAKVLDANGNLKVGGDTLKDYVKEMENAAKVKALQSIIEEYTEKIVEAAKTQIEAEHALEDAQNAATEAARKQNDVSDASVDAANRVAEAQKKLDDLYNQGKYGTEEYEAAQIELNNAMHDMQNGMVEVDGVLVNATDSLDVLTDSETVATGEAAKLNEEVEKQKAAVSEAQAEQDAYQAELDELMASMEGNTEAAGENAEAVGAAGEAAEGAAESMDGLGTEADEAAVSLGEAAKTIQEEYQELYDSAYNSLTNQSNLWQEFTMQTEHTTGELQNNLANQSSFYSAWASDLETVWNYAVQSGNTSTMAMVQQLANMGTDGAGHVHDLAVAIANEDYNMVNSFGNTVGSLQSAQADAANILALIEGGMVETADGLVYTTELTGQQITASMDRSGNDMQRKWGSTMQGVSSTTSTNMNSVASNVESGMNSAKNAVDSAGSPLETAADSAFGRVKAKAKLLEWSLGSSGEQAMYNFENGLRARGDSAVFAAESIANNAMNAFNIDGYSAYVWGYNLGVNFGNGIYSTANYVASAAATLANTVAAFLHHSTPDKGPLHDDDKWGGEFGEQFAAGMESQQWAVRSAAEGLASAAAEGMQSDVGRMAYEINATANPPRATEQDPDEERTVIEYRFYLGERDITDLLTQKVIKKVTSIQRNSRVAKGANAYV